MKNLVHSPKLRHLQWYVYPAYSNSPFFPGKRDSRCIKTKRKGIEISIVFHASLDKYGVCINDITIDVLPEHDAILLVEEIVGKIDKVNFFELLLNKLFSTIYQYPYHKALGYLSLWEKVQQNENQKTQKPSF